MHESPETINSVADPERGFLHVSDVHELNIPLLGQQSFDGDLNRTSFPPIPS